MSIGWFDTYVEFLSSVQQSAGSPADPLNVAPLHALRRGVAEGRISIRLTSVTREREDAESVKPDEVLLSDTITVRYLATKIESASVGSPADSLTREARQICEERAAQERRDRAAKLIDSAVRSVIAVCADKPALVEADPAFGWIEHTKFVEVLRQWVYDGTITYPVHLLVVEFQHDPWNLSEEQARSLAQEFLALYRTAEIMRTVVIPE